MVSSLVTGIYISSTDSANMKFISTLVLVGVVASASAVSFFSVVVDEWESFKVSNICVVF